MTVNKNWQRTQVRGVFEVSLLRNSRGRWVAVLRCWDEQLVANGFSTYDAKETGSKANAVSWLSNRLGLAAMMLNEQMSFEFTDEK